MTLLDFFNSSWLLSVGKGFEDKDWDLLSVVSSKMEVVVGSSNDLREDSIDGVGSVGSSELWFETSLQMVNQVSVVVFDWVLLESSEHFI